MVAAVQLAPLSSAHAEATLRWVRDPEVAAAIGLLGEATEPGTAAFVARAADDPATEAFAILEGGRHVGNVVLDLIERPVGTGRLSVYLGEAAARGRGVGRRAVELALDQAFGPLGLHKVWLIVHERNEAAIGAYEACGFRREGTLREEFLLDGERIDALRMGVLATDRNPS